MKDFFTINELVEHFGPGPKIIYRRLCAEGFQPCRTTRKNGGAWLPDVQIMELQLQGNPFLIRLLLLVNGLILLCDRMSQT
jgi:hypothetical protein